MTETKEVTNLQQNGLEKACPSLAAGVQVVQPEGAGYWIARVPETSRFFRLGSRERELLEQFDGSLTLTQIADRCTTKWGLRTSPQALQPLLTQLLVAKLLDPSSVKGLQLKPEDKNKIKRRSPNRQSLVFFKLKAVDPSRILDHLYPYVRPLLSRYAVSLYLALFALATVMAVVRFNLVAEQAGQLVNGGWRIAASLALLYAVNFPFIVAHEFAHALTARHFGLRVREMGFLLIFFNPALYADVSEAWGASRRTRLLVGFAGIALNLTVAATAFLAWLWFFRGGPVGEVLFLLALVSTVNSILNLNPLIRLDGYYLLGDWLRIPNLRTRSFRVIGQLVSGSKALLHSFPKRERRIYIAYGIVGGAYSIAIIGWAIYWSSLRLGYLVGPAGRVIGVLIIPTMFLASFALRRLPPPTEWRKHRDRKSKATAALEAAS